MPAPNALLPMSDSATVAPNAMRDMSPPCESRAALCPDGGDQERERAKTKRAPPFESAPLGFELPCGLVVKPARRRHHSRSALRLLHLTLRLHDGVVLPHRLLHHGLLDHRRRVEVLRLLNRSLLNVLRL